MDKSTPFTHPPEGYGRERRIAELEATIASFAAVDAVRREENAELEATIAELRHAFLEHKYDHGRFPFRKLMDILEKNYE